METVYMLTSVPNINDPESPRKIFLFFLKLKYQRGIVDDKINSEKEYIINLKQMAKDVISSFC